MIKVSLQANALDSPQFLPDGRHFLFHAQGTAPGVYIGQLGASEPPKRILDALAATYASSGHLLFVRQGTLFAQAFDPTRLELVGDPQAVADADCRSLRWRSGRVVGVRGWPNRVSDGIVDAGVPFRLVRPIRQGA